MKLAHCRSCQAPIISTLAGISRTSSDLDRAVSEFYRNGLIDKNGKTLRLKVP